MRKRKADDVGGEVDNSVGSPPSERGSIPDGEVSPSETLTREQRVLLALDGDPDMSRPEEFRYDAMQDGWWDINTGFFFPNARSVDALIPPEYWPRIVRTNEETGKEKETLIKPSKWLANVSNNYTVDTSTWWPGRGRIVTGHLAVEGAMVEDARRTMFNTYRPPPGVDPSAAQSAALLKEAERWVDHVKALWPEPKEHNYFFDYCAHMVQFPEEKCNAIVTLSGEQGIGKDMTLLPVKHAIGQWNVRDISPDDIASAYNPWAQCVMLVVNEMRPTKEDFHASSMYEKLKTLSVTPPDMLPISDKYLRQRFIMNVLRIFITTNKMHSMFIDPNDRRMGAVLHSPRAQGWREPSYFEGLASWLNAGPGNLAVTVWLRARDLSAFKPKSKPESTAAWQAIVAGWAPPQDAIAAALESLREPDAFWASEMLRGQFDGSDDIRGLLKSPRKLQHRLQVNGYFMKSFLTAQEFRPSSGNPQGKPFKSKMAFVKQSLMHEEESYMATLRRRGQLIADDIAILPVQASPKESDGGKF